MLKKIYNNTIGRIFIKLSKKPAKILIVFAAVGIVAIFSVGFAENRILFSMNHIDEKIADMYNNKNVYKISVDFEASEIADIYEAFDTVTMLLDQNVFFLTIGKDSEANKQQIVLEAVSQQTQDTVFAVTVYFNNTETYVLLPIDETMQVIKLPDSEGNINIDSTVAHIIDLLKSYSQGGSVKRIKSYEMRNGRQIPIYRYSYNFRISGNAVLDEWNGLIALLRDSIGSQDAADVITAEQSIFNPIDPLETELDDLKISAIFSTDGTFRNLVLETYALSQIFESQIPYSASFVLSSSDEKGVFPEDGITKDYISYEDISESWIQDLIYSLILS